MAYIAPNSTVEFFSNVGLNNNYDDTLYFASISAKDSYFSGLTKLATATAMTYNREQRGYIRVELPMSRLLSASYMRFKNTSFENKWFYAFVKNVEYINNQCTQINFEIDVLMTWMGNFTLGQCFIERQHTVDDAIGANIADEGLNLGLYVCEDTDYYSLGDPVVMMYKSYNKDKGDVRPSVKQQGTYNPLATYSYFLDDTNLGLLETKLNDLVSDNRIDEIVTMKLVPSKFVTNGSDVPWFNKNISKPYSNIGGSTYVPRNKKLYTYPFKYLKVENEEGQSTVYKYEYFNTLPDQESTGNCEFQIRGIANSPQVAIMCTPLRYNGMDADYDQSINMTNFPSLAWNVDTYKAYLAQRDSTIYGEMLASTIAGASSGVLSGAIHGGPGTAIAGAVTGASSGFIGGSKQLLSDTINEMMKGSIPTRMPDQTRGRAESDIMMQSGLKYFWFRKMSITKNYAMMIDSFFDMYGYAIRQHGIPNMNARPHWTYVKTIGCLVEGAIPADDASTIEDIFNKGVRFWKNLNEMGNYSLNNAPT